MAFDMSGLMGATTFGIGTGDSSTGSLNSSFLNMTPMGQFSNKDLAGIQQDPWSPSSMRWLQPIASYGWSQSGPWLQQQPYLMDLFGRANAQINAGVDPALTMGQNARLNVAGSLGPLLQQIQRASLGTAGGGVQALNFLTDPSLLYHWSNPYLASQGQAVVHDVNANLLENQLPAVRSGAVDAGQYGGSRQGVAEGLAIGKTNEQLSDALASLYGGAYQSGLNTMLGAAGQSNQTSQGLASLGQALAQLNLIPADIVSGVGSERTMLPWALLQAYQQAIGGKYGDTTQTVKTDPGYKVGESMIGSFKNLMGGIGGMMGGM